MTAVAGRFEVQAFGRVVWIIVTGPFDRQTAEAYRDRVIAVATDVCDQPWIRVTDIRGWELGGPEIIPPLHELMSWSERHNLAHSLNIVSLPHLQTYLLNKMMEDIPRNSKRHMMEEPSAAYRLLHQLGAGLSVPQKEATEHMWQQLA